MRMIRQSGGKRPAAAELIVTQRTELGAHLIYAYRRGAPYPAGMRLGPGIVEKRPLRRGSSQGTAALAYLWPAAIRQSRRRLPTASIQPLRYLSGPAHYAYTDELRPTLDQWLLRRPRLAATEGFLP